MIPVSVKQMIAWPLAFCLSGGFFLGCFEALKYLTSKASSTEHKSVHQEDDSQSAHQSAQTEESHTEKSHSADQTEPVSEPKQAPAQIDHHAGAKPVEHTVKETESKPSRSHGKKTH